MDSNIPLYPTFLLQPHLHGRVAKLCLPLPHSQGGDRGSESEPQCRVRWCTMTPFMGWVGNWVGNQWNYFYEKGCPSGQAGQACPRLSPPGTGSRKAPRPRLTGGQTPQDLTLRGPEPVRPLVG